MEKPGARRAVVKNKRKEITFLFVFVSVYLAASSLYYFSRPLHVPQELQRVNALVSAAVINTVTPQEAVTAEGTSLRSGGVSLSIGWGCEGIEGMFMITAALAAFYMRRKWKVYGMLAGTALIFSLNIFRLLFLWYTFRYKPALFDIMHVYIGQTFIIFAAVLFFVWWVRMFAHRPVNPAA